LRIAPLAKGPARTRDDPARSHDFALSDADPSDVDHRTIGTIIDGQYALSPRTSLFGGTGQHTPGLDKLNIR